MTDNTTTPENNPPSVGLADIAFLLQAIEIGVQRGAYRAEEMSSLGGVYDKVKAFIVANQPKQAEPAAETSNAEGN